MAVVTSPGHGLSFVLRAGHRAQSAPGPRRGPVACLQVILVVLAIPGAEGVPTAFSEPAKTPSALFYNDLRHVGRVGPYTRKTGSSNWGRSRPGDSAAGEERLRRRFCLLPDRDLRRD